ncbi:MAG: hypothetical protein NTV86_04495 [Planctomycetota bacterium]|nr:hypothetical protein [Planctomycetota bacterium]
MRAHGAAFLSTLALVLLFTAARIRFTWWPLHPVLFLALRTFPSTILAFSFLLGCGIRTAVIHAGGGRLYERVKPLMIGLIAGDLLGAFLPTLIGAVYHFATGRLPNAFMVLD